MKKLLLILYCIPQWVNAQQPPLFFETLTVQNGLSHNKVNCIIQDDRGFIWVGTDDGLNRFDGRNFVHFRHRLQDTTSLSGNIITDLLQDKQGNIWIASSDGGLTRYDYRLEPAKQFRQYRYTPSDPSTAPVNAINRLLDDNQGYLWLGTAGNMVIRFHKLSGKFEDIAKNRKTVLALCQDRNKNIWVGKHGGGITLINSSTLVVTEDDRYKDLYAVLPHVTVTAIFKDTNHDMWYGSWDKNIYRYDFKTKREQTYPTGGPYSFSGDEILCFAEDREGRLWIGGKEKGLHIYERKTGQFYNFKSDVSKEGTISDNRVNCIFKDSQGRMWLGTNRGISVNQPEKQQFVQQFLYAKDKTPVTIYAFYEDESNLWMGTNKGIFIRDRVGAVRQYELKYKGIPLQVSCFFRDENDFYIGTNYSLFLYDHKNGILTLLPNTEKDGVMNKIINSRIISVMKDTIDGHSVLVSLPYGHYMAYYDQVLKKWFSRLDSSNIVKRFNLEDNLIRKLYKARTGTTWVATSQSGLGKWSGLNSSRISYFRHQPGSDKAISNNNISDIVEDEKGNLWVSTAGGGLNYFDVGANQFFPIPSSNNLVEGIEVDDHNNVWMISNGNLHRYNPLSKSHTSFDLPDIEKTGGIKGQIFKDRKGNMYVAGANYYIVVQPDAVSHQAIQPKLGFTNFQIFNQSFSHLLQKDRITISHKDNHISFEFAAPDYTPGSNVQYAYMLEGFDKDWVLAGNRNYSSYSNLAGGDYTFKVRVTNTPGQWSEHEAAISLKVIPPYYKTWWFLVACTLAMIMAVYGIYVYRVNEILRRQEIRNKIAQDLHDNVGSTLSSISVYSQVARIYRRQSKEEHLDSALEKISSTSSEMISELNDTVWAINPRNDNMQVILQRMESFAKPLLASQGVLFHLRYNPNLTTLNLKMETRKNLYSIFKEAVNNAVKYAECKNFYTELQYKNRQVVVTMKDDGKGFDMANMSKASKSSDTYSGGNGLRNMQHRAREMRGTVTTVSEPGNGTSVNLVFPIT